MMTPRKELFCRQYIIDWNATQAAMRAGYSLATAESQGSRLLSTVEIKLRVAELADGIAEKEGLTTESVLRDIANIKAACMGLVQFNPAMALKACELEAKYLGILSDRIEHTGANGGPIETSFWVEFVPSQKKTSDNELEMLSPPKLKIAQ